MAIDPSSFELSEGQRRYLATRAARMGISAAELLNGLVPSVDKEGNLEIAATSPNGESALEAARRFGLVGGSSGDPPDLATNPIHMQGFGQDADTANSG